MAYCSVYGCNTRRVSAPLRKDSSFVFLFPKECDKDRRHAWTVFCGREGFIPGPKCGICSRHFTEEDYANASLYDFTKSTYPSANARLDLIATAIPTVNPPVPKQLSKSALERLERLQDKKHDQMMRSLLDEEADDCFVDGEDEDDVSELEIHDIEEMVIDDFANDPSWSPDDQLFEEDGVESGSLSEEAIRARWNTSAGIAEQKKFLVSGANLLDLLFQVPCAECGEQKVSADISEYGAVISLKLYCPSLHKTVWHSAGNDRKDTKVMNALLTGSILYTGSQSAKVSEYMSANNIGFPSQSLFFKYQLQMFCAIVLLVWLEEQWHALELAKRHKKLIIGGDARCDCMGYCAQYGSYGVMDLTTNRILDIQPISRVETGMNSSAMEKEGLVRSLRFLSEQGLVVTDLVTDQHPSITKMMKEEYSQIHHWFDSWHVMKGLRKKLVAVTKEKAPRNEPGYVPLQMDRVDSICNRFYYMAGHTEPNDSYADVMDEKRKAAIGHLVGVCEFPSHKYYMRCGHGDKKTRMDPESSVYKKVKKILSTPLRKKAIQKLSPHGQTSRLESYHRMVLSFAPKHLSFGFQGMNARLLLAALRYNENSSRDVMYDDSGNEKMKVSYAKYLGGKGKASKLRPPPTTHYLDKLMRLTERVVRGDEPVVLPELPSTPASMTSQLEKEDGAAVKSRYLSRFRLAEVEPEPEPLAATTSILAGAEVDPIPSTSGLQSPSLCIGTRPKASSTPSTSRVVVLAKRTSSTTRKSKRKK